MPPWRILITGSRDWTNVESIESALTVARESVILFLGTGTEIVIVHGAARGADRISGDWAKAMGSRGCKVVEEAHPADWAMLGKQAGPIRNQKMVDLGANMCLAFPLPSSRGTLHCMRIAREAGIPVVNFGV